MTPSTSLLAGTDAAPASPRTEARGGIVVEGVARCFGVVKALDSVRLTIRPGEYFCLLGPSGCGKTTLLRSIAGLEIPDAGQIQVDGIDLTSTPANERPVNTVFQSYALFPHLRVVDNVAFGLRMRKRPASEVRERVERMMRLTRVDGLARRFPHELSGGQRQRVALARAMVNEPHVLLLDEPLGALDLQLRKELQAELKALQRRLATTFVHVTHDQEEAMALSDRLAVMHGGRICQIGSPSELYHHPVSAFVAAFLGACNLVDGVFEAAANAGGWVRCALGRAPVPSGKLSAQPGAAVRLGIRPEHLKLVFEGATKGLDSDPFQFEARVKECVFSGAWVQAGLESNGVTLTALIPSTDRVAAGVRSGMTVRVEVPREACLWFQGE